MLWQCSLVTLKQPFHHLAQPLYTATVLRECCLKDLITAHLKVFLLLNNTENLYLYRDHVMIFFLHKEHYHYKNQACKVGQKRPKTTHASLCNHSERLLINRCNPDTI